jgi:hypothetical protein
MTRRGEVVTPIDGEFTRRFREATTTVDDEIPIDDDFGGGNTKAHYLPIEPRTPAPATVPPPWSPPSESSEEILEIAQAVDPPRSRSIAESFQDMLRQTFTAGAAAALSGETFETWYQREVLR